MRLANLIPDWEQEWKKEWNIIQKVRGRLKKNENI